MSIEKVVKGLKCCTNWKDLNSCNECPYKNKPHCIRDNSKDALTLIDELQAENEKLKQENTNEVQK